MQSIGKNVYKRICVRGHGWAFSDNDFGDVGSGGAVRIELFRLVKAGKIRRVIRGIYDYPKFSQLLGQPAAPDLKQVAQALARKFGWRIHPSGDTALNFLGLSTQVPGHIVYLSDGPHREYLVGKQKIMFQKGSLKQVALRYPESALVVQALETLKQDRFNAQVAKMIRDHFKGPMLKKILVDTRNVKGWIYASIRVICLGDTHE